ncbi:hypothetical protein [Pseudoduganella sp. R-34]|uniref:hypothetical protein n=1 Tax=Pseudoduganella sp. R-34 TaxID=3404062 RepID=UPI003CF76AD4
MERLGKVVYFFLLTTILFTCCLSIALILTCVSGISELSSWAQAIGGIGAIVAAFMIGNAQSSAAFEALERANEMNLVREFRALLAVSSELAKLSQRAAGILDTRDELAIAMTIPEWELPLDTLLAELREITGREFYEQDVLSKVIELKVSAAYLKTALTKVPDASNLLFRESNVNKFDDVVSTVHMNADAISQTTQGIERLFKKLNSGG